MKSDSDIQRDVENELKWDPQLDTTDIAVKVANGAVTLSGFARSFYERHQAQLSAKRVAGVIAIANDLVARPRNAVRMSDPEIAREAITALKMALPVGWQDIKIMVHDGRVVLEGTVEWQFVRERAGCAIRDLRGVLDVRNSIRLKPAIAGAAVKSDIEAAFKRNAVLDAGQVQVEVSGPQITLRGTVRSWAERDQAYQTAWSAPGVLRVIDELRIHTA